MQPIIPATSISKIKRENEFDPSFSHSEVQDLMPLWIRMFVDLSRVQGIHPSLLRAIELDRTRRERNQIIGSAIQSHALDASNKQHSLV